MGTDPDLVLGRALIAAVWTDGELDDAEREALEDLLLGMDGIAPDTWRALHADLERPVEPEHRERLFKEFESAFENSAARDRAARLVEQMIQRLSPGSSEASALEELARGLPEAESAPAATGILSRLGAALGNGLGLHSGALRREAESERAWENSLKERLANHWPEDEDWPEPDDLHRICAGAAILAHVVRLDGAIDPGELDALRAALQRQWGLGDAAARLATELVLDETAGGLDLHLLLREFQRSTSEDERKRFLAAVFTVAAGDGTATYDEIEEVRRIGRGLLLSHQHFISAKLAVPGTRRDT